MDTTERIHLISIKGDVEVEVSFRPIVMETLMVNVFPSLIQHAVVRRLNDSYFNKSLWTLECNNMHINSEAGLQLWSLNCD